MPGAASAAGGGPPPRRGRGRVTTCLARPEADADDRGMDPDRSAEDVLRTVPASVATPTSGRTDAEVARERATRRWHGSGRRGAGRCAPTWSGQRPRLTWPVWHRRPWPVSAHLGVRPAARPGRTPRRGSGAVTAAPPAPRATATGRANARRRRASPAGGPCSGSGGGPGAKGDGGSSPCARSAKRGACPHEEPGPETGSPAPDPRSPLCAPLPLPGQAVGVPPSAASNDPIRRSAAKATASWARSTTPTMPKNSWATPS